METRRSFLGRCVYALAKTDRTVHLRSMHLTVCNLDRKNMPGSDKDLYTAVDGIQIISFFHAPGPLVLYEEATWPSS